MSLIVICGATASGKSSLALKIAERLNTFIISADSRQIYQDFDIGTAKPTLEEQKLIPHYMIDICHPTENLTVAEYQTQVQHIIKNSTSIPLLVGGTGLYIKSITRGLKIPPVAPVPKLRSHLEAYTQAERYSFLQQIDSVSAEKIHAHDKIRTIRALEVYYVTGKTMSAQQGENPPNYPILEIGLHCDAEAIHNRIKKRTAMMLEAGLVEETRQLIDKYGIDLLLLNTLGYAEIKQYLQGEITLNKAEKLIVIHTRQFAKRQRTWFRKNNQIKWFDSDSNNLLEDIWLTINHFLEKNNNICSNKV